MKQVLAAVFLWVFALPASAEGHSAEDILALWAEDKTTIFQAGEVDLSQFVWIARPVVVFADSPNDPRLRQQLDLLAARPDDLADRDVIVLVDTDPEAGNPARIQLRPRGFMLAIIGKDGQVELRKPAPWDVREISRTIDKMPLRQQEVEDRRAADPLTAD